MDRSELGEQLNLKVELVPAGRPNRSGRTISAKFVTIHNTSNPNSGADADAHSRFVREKGFYILASGKRNDVSWHYTVDDTKVIKHLPVNERAIHAGKGNANSIAIEICMHAENDQAAADLRAAKLVAVLMHDLGISKENIKSHQFWTGKQCPTLLLAKFDEFCALAAGIRASITAAPSEDDDGSRATDETVTDSEMVAVALARETMNEGDGGPTEDDPAEMHDLVAAQVSAFAENR